jgi:hypothetical protein
MVEVLQAYSSKGRHYETRFDKILETTNRSAAVRKPLKLKAKSSAKIVHRLSAIEQADIAARYQQGWSSRRLAKAYGISKTSIIQLLREANISIRNQGLSSDQVGEARRLHGSGCSLVRIGERFNVSAEHVRQKLMEDMPL